MNMLNFYNAETLWPYITGEKDIPRNDSYTDYYRIARDFGKLCALTSLQKATSNPSCRPLDYEFVDIYNGITKAILATLEMGQSEHISMTNLNIIAEYIGPTFTDQQTYKQGLDVVLKGDISNVYVGYSIGESIVDEEHRKKIIGYFSRCLKGFIDLYGISETKKITNISSQIEVNYKRN